MPYGSFFYAGVNGATPGAQFLQKTQLIAILNNKSGKKTPGNKIRGTKFGEKNRGKQSGEQIRKKQIGKKIRKTQFKNSPPPEA